MEPNEALEADYDVSPADEKKRHHLGSKSEISELGTHNDITNRQSN